MIIFCKECNNRMNLAYHFEEGKASTYYVCKKCFFSTKPKAMDVTKVLGERDSEDKKIPQNSKRSTVIKRNNSKKPNKYSKGV